MDEKKNEIILFENQGVRLILKDYMLKGYAVNQKRLEYCSSSLLLLLPLRPVLVNCIE